MSDLCTKCSPTVLVPKLDLYLCRHAEHASRRVIRVNICAFNSMYVHKIFHRCRPTLTCIHTHTCNSQLQQEIKQHYLNTQASQQVEAAEVLADLSYTLKVCTAQPPVLFTLIVCTAPRAVHAYCVYSPPCLSRFVCVQHPVFITLRVCTAPRVYHASCVYSTPC